MAQTMLKTRVAPFFKFAIERHNIWTRRNEGEKWPWTSDKILQTYKFTNVFRELDAVTVWMRKNITQPNANDDPMLMLFNCALFRFTGSPAPYDAGTLPKWTNDFSAKVRTRYKTAMAGAIANGQQVFTGAYIIPNLGLAMAKQDVVIDVILKPLWEHLSEAPKCFKPQNTMKPVFDWLHQMDGMGGNGFMAYEIVTDLRWTSYYSNPPADRMSWANAGPGARRGLNRILDRDLDKRMSATDACLEMGGLLEFANEGMWPSHFPKLEMRDIEHTLCEFDKYERVRLKQGRPRSVYRQPTA